MLIDSENALKACCRESLAHSFCAMDVEFVRRKTYAPIVSLVQLCSTADAPYLVDTLAIEETSAIADFLLDTSCIKIFHSCSQDLEALDLYCNALPMPCFDTQIAAAFCGIGYQVSFAGLVDSCLGRELDKQLQTSDWTRRPLTPQQITYAERDVTLLLECYGVLHERLQSTGRLDWVLHECAGLTDDFSRRQYAHRVDPMRVRGAGRLSPQGFTLLAELLKWREDLAARRNRPSKWMLSNQAVLDICFQLPETLSDLLKLNVLTDNQSKSYTDTIMSLVERVKETPSDELKRPPRSHPPTKREKALIKTVGEKIAELALEWSIAHEIIATHREVSHLVRKKDYEGSSILKGWRGEVVGQEVLKLLEPGS